MDNSEPKLAAVLGKYKAMGIEFKTLSEDVISITQKRLVNGYVLNNKQLYDRAKQVYPGKKIRPIVFSLQVDNIDISWILDKMREFGINRKDLIKQLAIDKSSLSLILSGKRELSKPMRALFYYYFMTYELNRDLRAQLNH